MRRTIFIFVEGVLALAAVLLLIFAAQLVIDLIAQGRALALPSAFDIADFRHINNLYNRSLNQLTGVIFTTVAIAVPLTANMYSLKFLEFFIRDPVNAIALIFVILTNANNTWTGYVAHADYIPILELNVTSVMSLLCYAMAFPYLYYVFRFLHPDTLLERLADDTTAQFAAASHRPLKARALRLRTSESIEHFANIATRSVDRIDRNTALESVFALDRVTRQYWLVKGKMAENWFKAEHEFFLGYSPAAIDDLTASRIWVEMKVFGQLYEALRAAIPRMPELTSVVAETLRKLGLEEAARADPALRELVVIFFNSFVRLALNRRDARSVFAVFDQYRAYAEAVNGEAPELGQEIAYYFQYYAQIARDMQLTFVVEAIAHDLGVLVRAAWTANAANRQRLLERFLEFDSQASSPLPGVKKAQAILGSYFLLEGQETPAKRIRESFLPLPASFNRQVYLDLIHVRRDKYWEVSERRINIDYVPGDQRMKLDEFFDGLY